MSGLRILIVEGNTPEMISGGCMPASHYFIQTFAFLDRSIECKVVYPYKIPFQVEELEKIDGVVFTGSGVQWSCDRKEAAPLRRAMKHVFEVGFPVWGSCNGLQLAAVILGGAVVASPNGPEVGLSKPIRKTENGKVHLELAGREDVYVVPCIHRDEIKQLPKNALILAENDHSPIQAFAYCRDGLDFWGTQYHPECTALSIAKELKASNNDFPRKISVINDLEVSEIDPAAAKRLGSTCKALRPAIRTIELCNWLKHVKDRKRA